YKIVGNPDLVYNHFRSLSINFSKYIPRTKVNFNVRSSITRTSDNFAQQVSLDANGATTITTINSDANTAINLSGGIGKQLGNPQKLGVSLSTNFYSSYNKSPFFFNN